MARDARHLRDIRLIVRALARGTARYERWRELDRMRRRVLSAAARRRGDHWRDAGWDEESPWFENAGRPRDFLPGDVDRPGRSVVWRWNPEPRSETWNRER